MSAKVNYFEAQRPSYPREDTALVVAISAIIPTTLSALESRSGRSFWSSDADYSRALIQIRRQQWELLMDATDRIINELRALRDGPNTPPEARDPALDPYSLQLFTLREIAGRLSTNGESAAFILAQIRDALRSEEDGETAVNVLRAIASIVVGL